MDAGRQLILDLAREPGFDADDFLVSPSNAAAYAMIDLWPDWSSSTLVLCGPPGSGKTHLTAIWARHAGAVVFRAGTDFDPENLATQSAVLVEDADRAGLAETALFHFVNLMAERHHSLVITARKRPDQWGLATPDLLSRLRRSPLVEIGRPNADLMRAVLVKLFADRQIRVDEDVVTYATLHLDQSLDAVLRFVQAIDEAALVAGRRITRPLAVTTIASLQANSGATLD